jgi:LuxR family maltose regulon positive regulatory protein
MSLTILTTKLSVPPPRPDWVLRPRLTDRLAQALSRKLTLVCAPAGFGKTTLITSWLHGQAEPRPSRVAWLSFDQDDNTPLAFISYLIAALQTLDPAIGQTAKSLLEEPIEGRQRPAGRHLMTLLLNDLAALPEMSVLVLDDFHVIDHPDVQTALAFFLEHLPSRLHLVVATREEPALPLARLRVQSAVTEIRLQDLRFTREETTAFLDRTMGLQLSPEAVASLETRTEGWVAALQMAALSLRGRESTAPGLPSLAPATGDFGGTHRYLIDYLAAEVLRQQPAEVRAFLRQTAILDRLSGPLCDAVTSQADSRSRLRQLEKANLFLIPLDDEQQWYRYHALFADFLRTELGEDEQRALHRRAADWHEAHGFLPEAIKHALSAHDLVAAERLIRNSVDATLNSGGFSTLLGWLNALPPELVRARSDLAAYKAWILYLRWEIAEAEDYAAAANAARSPDDPPVQRGMLLGFQSYLALTRGDPARAVELGHEALSLLGDTRSFFRTTALCHLGQAQRLTGHRHAAIQTLRQAVTLGRQLGNHLITLEALGYLTLLQYQQGQLPDAIALCREGLDLYTDARGQPLSMAGLVYVPLGSLYFETGDQEHARHYLTTGIELCKQVGTVYYTLAGQRTLAKLHFAAGETALAWDMLAAARRLAEQSGSQRRLRMVNVMIAELELREGQIAASERTLAGLRADPEARSEHENLIVAHLLLAKGDADAARTLLQGLEDAAQQKGRLGTLVGIHVLQARAEQVQRRPAAALGRLEQALSLAAHAGYRRAFLDEGAVLVPLLTERRHVAPEFVDGLLAALGPSQPSPRVSVPDEAAAAAVASANQALIEPLGASQLEILRLVAEGRSNQEIGDTLGITLGTTKWHLNQIYGKLGVASRTQAVAEARRAKLL